MGKRSVLYTHNGIFFIHNEGWLIHATMCINLQKIILSKRSQTQSSHIAWLHLYEICGIDKSIQIEHRLGLPGVGKECMGENP